MKYLDKSFSVSPGASDSYRENWDRIFGKKSPRERYLGLAEELATAKARQDGAREEALLEELAALWEQLSESERKGLKRAPPGRK